MNAAVFVDFENLYLSLKNRDEISSQRTRELSLQILEGLSRHLSSEGHTKVIGRSYAAFDSYPGSEVAHDLALMGLDPQYVLISHSGKNAADIQLSIHAAKVVFRRADIELIVIVSGDRDFIPLAGQVLEEGRELQIVGIPDATSGDLRDRVGPTRFLDALTLLPTPVDAESGDDAESERGSEPLTVVEEPSATPPPMQSGAAEGPESPESCEEHPTQSAPSSGPTVVGKIPVTWAQPQTGTRSQEDMLLECLELLVRSRLRHSSSDIWLSPFLKGPMSQHFSHLIHPERRALINELRNRQVIRVEERENAYAEHPYSVIVIDDGHPMAQIAVARLQRQSV